MAEVAEQLVLETERPGVIVREVLTDADDAAFQDSYEASRDDLARIDPFAIIRHLSPEATRGVREYGRTQARVFTGVWDRDTFVASVDIRPQPDGSAEIGYWTDSRRTGNHYASLGAAAVVKYLSGTYQRVITRVEPHNGASMHVSENAGLQLAARGSKWFTYELIGERPCPFPSLEGLEHTVEKGDYRKINGSDATLLLTPDDLDIIRRPNQHYPELLPGVRMQGVYSTGNRDLPIVSFLYNKLDGNGQRERDPRVIIAEGIGYGVHSGHLGQPPTWYLIGPKVGTINHQTGEFESAIQSATEVPSNNFSIACITGGPFGVPMLANPEQLQK